MNIEVFRIIATMLALWLFIYHVKDTVNNAMISNRLLKDLKQDNTFKQFMKTKLVESNMLAGFSLAILVFIIVSKHV